MLAPRRPAIARRIRPLRPAARASRVNISGSRSGVVGQPVLAVGALAPAAAGPATRTRRCSRSAVTVRPASITACTISPRPWFHSYCSGGADGRAVGVGLLVDPPLRRRPRSTGSVHPELAVVGLVVRARSASGARRGRRGGRPAGAAPATTRAHPRCRAASIARRRPCTRGRTRGRARRAPRTAPTRRTGRRRRTPRARSRATAKRCGEKSTPVTRPPSRASETVSVPMWHWRCTTSRPVRSPSPGCRTPRRG